MMKQPPERQSQLAEIIGALESGVSLGGEDRPIEDGELGVLKVSCVYEGRFLPTENKRILHSGNRHRGMVFVRTGDLLISRANTYDLVGACGLVQRDYPNLFLPDKLWRVVLRDPKRDDIRWLVQVLNSPALRRELKIRANGTSGSMKNISKQAFLGITVFRPEYEVQRTIAKTLGAWDEAIFTLEDLIDAKSRFKRALMEQLFTRRVRFRGFLENWHAVRLKDVIQECEDRNQGRFGNARVMGVTKTEGIVPMRERTIASKIDRYLIVKKNWFAYNPMRLNIGSIARWTADTDVLVSPDYVVFRCKDASELTIDADFLDQFRRSSLWERHVLSAGNGSVRVRIYFPDLGEMKLTIPSVKEQQKIAAVLNSADREIDLLRNELGALKKQKRALMQKLLTCQLRVSV